jgi:hypothetical protein
MKMKSNTNKTAKLKQMILAGVLPLAAIAMGVIGTTNLAFSQDASTTFQSPAEAGDALVKAAKNHERAALAQILGPETTALLSTGDKEEDEATMDSFVAKYQKMNRWLDMSDGSSVLYIGADNFAFPVPLAKDGSGRWYFDAVAGAEEIRARDIGRNELLTIDACAAIASAQEIYFTSAGSLHEFAQRIISTSSKQDGLFWPAGEKETPSPLSDLDKLPKHSLGSSGLEEPLTLDGYTLRILTAQGDDAPGGALSYIVDGKMIGGFAILATPVKYGETGIMTFMTGRDGVIYERDLGPDTAKIATSIKAFNPTDEWLPVE